ncbi:hypothetical protein [Clostridium sp. 'White wine YQ']|uniref:hypothetical protein n=1 Tax=Clostridium sp. 'White wine YQ' TaxID=3027474 RepID=UPI0023672BC7|nr:hypothetical protein [Clostridium sp. 'White wine YQ']MDD7793135.1 hypothetical protein [Clostridium sp. 'White wine YQ']
MRIYVKAEGRSFFIPCPLVFAKWGMSLVKTPFIMKNIPEEERKYVEMIDFKELSNCLYILKEYKGLTLVDVKAKDGTIVKITI